MKERLSEMKKHVHFIQLLCKMLIDKNTYKNDLATELTVRSFMMDK